MVLLGGLTVNLRSFYLLLTDEARAEYNRDLTELFKLDKSPGGGLKSLSMPLTSFNVICSVEGG